MSQAQEKVGEPEGEFVSERMGMMISAVLEDKQKERMDALSSFKTNEDRFNYIWKLDSLHEVIRLESEYTGKSTEEAAKLRAAGNNYFQKKSYISAMDSYNKSIIQAPMLEDNSEETNHLALSYANRSACLLHLKRYHDCLHDIECAIESGYPKDAMYKLCDRQGKCYTAIRDKVNAVQSFTTAKENISESGLDDKVRTAWIESLDRQIKASETIKREITKRQPPFIVPDSNKPRQEKYPSFANSVNIEYTKQKGRHIVAAEDVMVGDVLAVESPYASVLFQEYHLSYCNSCFIRTDKPVSCKQCSSVIYCSRECRESAWNVYHKYECQYYALFDKFLCARIGHLAIRLVMVAGRQFLLDFLQNEKNRASGELTREQIDLNKAGIYAGDYSNIYHLDGHTKNRFPGALFDYTVIAAFLMKTLIVCGFFREDDQDHQDETSINMIGGVLLHHLLVIQCNGNRIQQLQASCQFDQPQCDLLGVAIYPSASLVNHACDPVADFNYYGNKVILRAIRMIYQGEEATVSYGPVFYDARIKVRKQVLLDCYFFSCECIACTEQWPTVANLEDCMITFRCEACRGELDLSKHPHKKIAVCEKCEHKQNMEEVVGRLQLSHDVYASAMADAFGGKYHEALGKFIDHLLLLQKSLCQPWRDFTSCQVSIKHCFRLLENK